MKIEDRQTIFIEEWMYQKIKKQLNKENNYLTEKEIDRYLQKFRRNLGELSMK